MARPERNNVDYFPFICKEGKTMYYIEEKYGNDGFATWIKILRQMAVTDYHFLSLSKKVDVMFLSSKCKVSEQVLISIIDDLAEMGEFEHDLWFESKVLFSVKFIDHIKDAYIKRNNKCITLEGLLTLLSSLGIRKLGKVKSKVPVNPQTKVNYTKEDKSKEEQTKEDEITVDESPLNLWPTFDDFWNRYDKKTGKPKAETYWKKIEQRAREKIMEHLDQYTLIDKQYRKDPERYLKNKSWEDEVILKQSSNGITPNKREQNLISLAEDLAIRAIASNP